MTVGDPRAVDRLDVDRTVSAVLLPGERMIWRGRPAQGLLFVAQDLYAVPFSIMWFGFTVYWTYNVSKSPNPGFFYLWGIIFNLIGLYVVAGRFFVDAWMRKKTEYALTDRRVLIVRTGSNASTKSLSLDRLPEVELIGGDKPRGTLRFGPAASSARRFGWSPATDPVPQFLAIENPRHVFELVMRASEQAGRRS